MASSFRIYPPAPWQQQALTSAYKTREGLSRLTEEEWEAMKKDWLAAKAASRKSPKRTYPSITQTR